MRSGNDSGLVDPAALGRGVGRIPVANAWYMLLYAWDLAEWKDQTRTEAERSPTLLALVARILVDATERLLQRDFERSHASTRASIGGVRGRIDFARSLKRLDFEHGRAHCSFSRLDVDTPRNRILRATLHALSRSPWLDRVHVHKATLLRRQLSDLVGRMTDVSLVQLTGALFRQLQLGRNDRAYALPMALCRLVHRMQLPGEATGDDVSAILLRDEATFRRIFERFVRSYYKLHLAGSCDVIRERLGWRGDIESSLVPVMETDVSITDLRPPHRRLVIDTKFVAEALSGGRYGGEKLRSPHLYQLYTYLRTQEDRGEAYRTATGMLLYPTVAHHLDARMRVQAHGIHIRTVDLSRPWPEIEARLDEIAHAGLEDRDVARQTPPDAAASPAPR